MGVRWLQKAFSAGVRGESGDSGGVLQYPFRVPRVCRAGVHRGFLQKLGGSLLLVQREFKYAIANRAAVSCAEGEKVGVIGEDEIPPEALKEAKRIGKRALEALPRLKTPAGQPIGMTLIRTDIGCADSKVHDKDTHWDPDVKTYFLNEIEYGGTTYFPRVLKFDAIPMWAEMYASKALEIQEKMAVFSKATVESLQATADSPGDSDSYASASSASTE